MPSANALRLLITGASVFPVRSAIPSGRGARIIGTCGPAGSTRPGWPVRWLLAAPGVCCGPFRLPILRCLFAVRQGLFMKSLQGQFLVAAPQLRDPNFLRAVVLILQHDDEGAMGLIVNRPGSFSVREAWQDLLDEDLACDAPLYVGGPVAGPLLILHKRAEHSESEVLPGVHIATSAEAIEAIAEHVGTYRVFNGYSGWGPGQLESELELGGWLTIEASQEAVFSESDSLWQNLTQQIGRRILAPALSPEQLSVDPSLN